MIGWQSLFENRQIIRQNSNIESITIELNYKKYNIHRIKVLLITEAQQSMSTIRAKQQICVNLNSIRCFSTYSTGRYCLRFSLHETHLNSEPQPHNYAIPVSVIESKSGSASNCEFEFSQHFYYTKPFLLKPNTQSPINQLCVFKHDINIFNSKYETDYHEIVMKCTCQLISLDFTGSQGKVVGVFEGKLRGAGVGDALIIDFGEGVACQVVGTIHNCIYQFQYVWVGSRKGQTGVMKDSISMQSNELVVVNSKNVNNQNNQGPISINFEKYCQLQSKEYVESLLQYLLAQVKKSDDKISLSLQLFQSISPQKQQGVQQKLANSQIVEQPQPLLDLSELEKSLRSQSQLQIQSLMDQNAKSRLSILKSQSVYYQAGQENSDEIIIDEQQYSPNFQDSFNNMYYQEKNQKASDIEVQKKQRVIQPKIIKKQSNGGEVFIVLDSDEQKMDVYDPKQNRYKNIATKEDSALQIKIDVKQPSKYSPIRTSKQKIFDNKLSVLEYNQKTFNNKNEAVLMNEREEQENKNKRRRKIFVHSQQNINQNSNIGFSQLSKLTKLKQHNEQRQFDVQASLYEARFIPNKPTNGHPNRYKNQQKREQQSENAVNRKGDKNDKKSVSRVTIQQFEKLLHSNCLNIYQKWRKYINYLAQPEGIALVNAYKAEYRKKLESLLGESIIRFKGSFDVDIYSKEETQRNKMAYQIREQTIQNQQNIQINQFRFYPVQLFAITKPILFEQKFEKSAYSVQNQHHSNHSKKSFISVSLSQNQHSSNLPHHILILVHGLGACRLDMEKLKAEIRRNFKQKVHVYISCANEGRTQGDIALMGVRLSHEVQQQISKNGGSQSGNKISFIGHSMGGIIIRSALPRLQKYKHMFHSFVSLSSPHVGYCISSSKLIDVGLWLINNWKKCESILQLTMSDNPSSQPRLNLQECFLYKLSLQKGLQWFKKLTFMGSRQDLYVPYFSARIQKPEQIQNESRMSQYNLLHSKMVDNILGRITGSVTRIDVNFCITQQNIDNLIGRAAHICFVSSLDFLRVLTVADEACFI